MSSVKKDLPDVEGCHAVEIFNDIKNPHQYTLVESWAEKKLHEKHIQNLIESGSWKAISGLLATEPAGAYFNQLL